MFPRFRKARAGSRANEAVLPASASEEPSRVGADEPGRARVAGEDVVVESPSATGAATERLAAPNDAARPRSRRRGVLAAARRVLVVVGIAAALGIGIAIAFGFYSGVEVGVEIVLVAIVASGAIVYLWPKYR